MSIDTDGKPWLIEVNTRDQRITFLQAVCMTSFVPLHQPIAHCSHLNQKLSTPERRAGCCKLTTPSQLVESSLVAGLSSPPMEPYGKVHEDCYA